MSALVNGRPADDWPGIRGCDWGMGSRVYARLADGSHVRGTVVGATQGVRGWVIAVRHSGSRIVQDFPFDLVQRAWPTKSCEIVTPCCQVPMRLVYRGPEGRTVLWDCICGQTYQHVAAEAGRGHRWQLSEDVYPMLPEVVCWATERTE